MSSFKYPKFSKTMFLLSDRLPCVNYRALLVNTLALEYNFNTKLFVKMAEIETYFGCLYPKRRITWLNEKNRWHYWFIRNFKKSN